VFRIILHPLSNVEFEMKKEDMQKSVGLDYGEFKAHIAFFVFDLSWICSNHGILSLKSAA